MQTIKITVIWQPRSPRRAFVLSLSHAQTYNTVQFCSQVSKMVKFLISTDPVKEKGLHELCDGFKLFTSQLNRISIKPCLNTHELVEEGSAVEYTELCAHSLRFCTDLLKYLEKDEAQFNLEAAFKCQDALLLALLTQLPSQRTPLYTSIQIARSKEDLLHLDGNFITYIEAFEVWRLHINIHKMDGSYNIPPIDIVKGSALEGLLGHFSSWAEARILSEAFNFNLENDGCAFFSMRGSPYSSSSFYTKMIQLFQTACGNPNLKVGPRLLRHLLADSSIYDSALPEQQGAVAFLAGHSKKVEERVYKTPVPSHKQLNAAAAFCHQAQLLNASKHAEYVSPSLQLTTTSSHSQKLGKPIEHLTDRPLLDAELVAHMSNRERRAAFEDLYGVATNSSNQASSLSLSSLHSVQFSLDLPLKPALLPSSQLFNLSKLFFRHGSLKN